MGLRQFLGVFGVDWELFESGLRVVWWWFGSDLDMFWASFGSGFRVIRS